MKIVNLDALKFTSIKFDGGVIHFNYMGNDYTLINGGLDSTLCIRLFEGNTKGKTNLISYAYGWIPDLILYKYNKEVLKFVDKEYFVWRLKTCGILE